MKVLCSACEAAQARVLCCADEAALCASCDRDVHAANRLAGKHHRLPLQPPAAAPNCDICQECHAYFFCVEDRALLCRSCDVAVHSANAFVSAHRRFLLTGVQVGLQPQAQQETESHPSATASTAPAPLQTPPLPAKNGGGIPSPLYSDDDIDWTAGPDGGMISSALPDWSVVDEQFSAPVQQQHQKPAEPKPASKRSAVAATCGGQGGVTGGVNDWPLDDFFGFSEFNAGLVFTENGTSKADSGKLGSTGGSPNEVQHQWSVPELPSPPTASGLHWQAGQRHINSNSTATDAAAVMFVPDISSPENPFRCFTTDTGYPQPAKRRRC